jgi:hypothetical protein
MCAATTASAVHIDAVFSTAHGLPTVNQETSFLGHHVLGLCVGKIPTFVSHDGIKTFKFMLRDVAEATSTTDVYCHGAWADALSFIEPGDQTIIIGSRVERRGDAEQLFQMVIHEESVSQPDVMVALNGNRKFLFHISKHNLLTHRAPGQHARRLSKHDNTVPIIPSSFHGEDPPYTSLAAAVAAGSSSALLNIWAVVTEFSPPRPTKGTDTHVLLTVIDDSAPQPVRASLFIKVGDVLHSCAACPSPAFASRCNRMRSSVRGLPPLVTLSACIVFVWPSGTTNRSYRVSVLVIMPMPCRSHSPSRRRLRLPALPLRVRQRHAISRLHYWFIP